MQKEDEYVVNSRGTLASYDVKLKFYLLQLFQSAQKNQFLSSLVMFCYVDANIQTPAPPLLYTSVTLQQAKR